jgi:hypothetical protein
MNAFEIKAGRVQEGIRLTDGKIVLGQEGRGRRLTTVPLPPEATVEEGFLRSLPGPEKAALVLIRDHSGFRGGWQLIPPGVPIAQGHCAQGDAGRMGGGPEYLICLRSGGVVEIHRSGRLYGQPDLLKVGCREGSVTVTDPLIEAQSSEAARLLSNL